VAATLTVEEPKYCVYPAGIVGDVDEALLNAKIRIRSPVA
jgi:hypothetical protein